MNEQIKNNSDAYRNDDGNSSEAVIRNATSVIFANTLQNSICRNYLSDSTNLYIAPIKKHDKLREELKGESDGS